MLAVTNVGSGEAAEPVTGLEATLRAEQRGAGERMPLPLAPQVDSDGSGQEAETGLDEAPFLLTTPGDYKVRLVGNIEGIPIDAALFPIQSLPAGSIPWPPLSSQRSTGGASGNARRRLYWRPTPAYRPIKPRPTSGSPSER